MRAAHDFCPTGNEADLASTTPTPVALANPLRQGGEVYDDLTKDYFGGNGSILEDYSGIGTQVGIVYGDEEYSSAGLDTPGVGGLGGVGGYSEGAVGGEEPAPEYTGPPISGGSGYTLPPDAVQVRGRFPQTAGSDQTLYRANAAGEVTSYEQYDASGLPIKRVDLVGPEHGGIPTPHVHEFVRNQAPDGTIYVNTGPVRPATPEEIP